MRKDHHLSSARLELAQSPLQFEKSTNPTQRLSESGPATAHASCLLLWHSEIRRVESNIAKLYYRIVEIKANSKVKTTLDRLP